MAAWNLTQQGHRRPAARCRRQVRSVEVLDARAALGGAGADGARRAAAAVLSRYQGAAVPHAGRTAVRADARLGTRRQDQRLGPRQPALLARWISRRRSATAGRSRGRSRTPDIAPYYDQVEQLIGVCGGTDDSDVLPGSKFLQPPPAPRCGERLLQKAMPSSDIPVVAGRRANMTRPTRGFPPCHYCGNCGAGCDTASFFCSADHLLPFALKTGQLEIRSNAVVARILTDEQRSRQRRAVFRSADRRGAAGARQRSSSSARAASTRRASCSTRSPSGTRTASATGPT